MARRPAIPPVRELALPEANTKPRKRGRPPKYATKAERDAAHAAAKRDKRERKRKRKEQSRLARMSQFEPTGALALRIQLHRAIDQHQPESVIAELYDQVVQAEEMEAYDRDIAREQERDEKRDAVTVGDLNRGAGMKRGQFLTGAPEGEGVISTGLPKSVIKTGRVTPKGYGSHRHEEVPAHEQQETAAQFVDKQFRRHSWLRCYRPGCSRKVVGILPQNVDKPGDKRRFHCYRHSPIHNFRGHENGDSLNE